MCGIIAISGKEADKIDDSKVSAMLACLSRRGPDDRGFDRFDKAIIGQTRLSIVDLSGGHQPMKDNKFPYSVVFNGEIYGYKETRKDLENKGHVFSSHSDTEVILKAYAEYGKDCVMRLDGMFAFAIWDESKKELFIARDRFGKKPLYYTMSNGVFISASEIKSIFASGLIKGQVDPEAIDDYLRLMYIPSHKSIYKNISILPPAHAGIVKDGSLTTWRYWKLEKKPLQIAYEDAKKEIKRLFEESVRKRMVADVEVGSLLSGGIDSTIVTLEAQKFTDRPIKTFSVGYGSHINELPFAKTASEKIGTEHYTINIEKIDFDSLRETISYFDEPHADTSNYPQALVSKLAASKVKVALSGDGADELFMGYGWYQKYWHTPFLQKIFKNPWKSYKELTEVFNEQERASLLAYRTEESDLEKEAVSGIRNGVEKINAFDLNIYLPGQLLSKVDRTSMMHSLEVRCPFLDTRLAEFVYNLPTEFKLSKNENKIILKDILSEIFPREFVYRRKQGFGAPIKDWLQDEKFMETVESILRDEKKPIWKFISRDAVKTIKNRAIQDPKNKGMKLWSIVCLSLWFDLHQQFHDK